MAAVKLGEDPTRFLSTVQIGITSIGVLNGVVGESTLAAPLGAWLQGFGVSATTAGYVATAIVVAGLTYFSIVLGELVPKRLGQMAPEAIARMAPARFRSSPLPPALRQAAVGSTRLVLRCLGENQSRPGSDRGGNPRATGGRLGGRRHRAQEHTMVRNVFRLDDRQLASLMVPRGDVVYLDVEESEDENLRRIENRTTPAFRWYAAACTTFSV
jgi:putative hemolysin